MTQALRCLLFALWVLPGLLVPAGCGTETGNPDGFVRPQAPASQSGNPAVALMEALCGKLAACDEAVSLSDCRTALAQSPTLAATFGAPESAFPTYLDLVAETGSLTLDPGALALCLDSVGSLACQDPAVRAVRFADGSVENLEAMVPDAGCPDVFSAPDPGPELRRTDRPAARGP